ncbi:MAG: GTPase [Gammaproteobacteria bacterium]
MSTLESDPSNNPVYEIEDSIDDLYVKQAKLTKQALTYNYISPSQFEAQTLLLNNQDQHNPQSLFGSEKQNRPLVVALFGGTGVGKSTLLNRVANKEIARTGVERPTSREVTIFLHASVEIKHLPQDFPVEKVNIRQHQDQTKKEILLIDMPDIDSVETENLQIVRDWIPYIDVLIYVVSPERYRDDRGWHFLVDQGYQHAWLFVMNQWGLVEQEEQKVMEDFETLLQSGGFDQPLIFRTDCVSVIDQDDFDQFTNYLTSVANSHTINELKRRGIFNQLQNLKLALQTQMQMFGKREAFDQLQVESEKNWSQTTLDIQQHLDLTIQKAATKFAENKPSIFDWFKKGNENVQEQVANLHVQKKSADIWNDRAQNLVSLALNKIILAARDFGLPTNLLKEQFDQIEKQVEKKLALNIQKGLQSGLVNPGNRLHRFIHKLLGMLTTLLPIAALVWVAYKVINVFYSGTSEGYLGINYAIHSFLLVIVAWIIPFLLHRKSQPSLRKAAQKGINEGLKIGLAEVVVEIDEILIKNRQIQDQLLTEGKALADACDLIKPVMLESGDPAISRMLQNKLHRAVTAPKLRSP